MMRRSCLLHLRSVPTSSRLSNSASSREQASAFPRTLSMVVVEHPRRGYLRAGLCRCVLFAGVLVSSSMTDRRHKEGVHVDTISPRVLQIDSQLHRQKSYGRTPLYVLYVPQRSADPTTSRRGVAAGPATI